MKKRREERKEEEDTDRPAWGVVVTYLETGQKDFKRRRRSTLRLRGSPGNDNAGTRPVWYNDKVEPAATNRSRTHI